MDIRPLHADFAAEVRDFGADPTAQTIADLRDALDQYQLLVLRCDAPLPPERQVEIASWFGTPVDNGDGALWTVLQNEDAAGAIKLPFHMDLTYTDHPIKLITLQALELPPGGTSTSFVSNVSSWASLPAELQGLLEPMTVRHRHASKLGLDWPEFIAHHPACKRHPRTGRPMLFVSEHHAERILELDPARSDEILARLFAHLYADERVYTHRWRPGDLLIWDNLAAQHARREAADLSAGKRALRRVVIGDVAFPELVERARRQEAERARATH
jgi:taurine dioxygenase